MKYDERDCAELASAAHQWAFNTRTFRKMFGQEGGETGVDDQFAARSFENVGAWVLGRNMFGPVRGPWPDDTWKGWWGANPPYHVPVFVLTHHARAPIVMDGGTTFHFVSDGIKSALAQAREAAALDGPFAETKEALLGFYLIDGDSLDEAIDLAEDIGRNSVMPFVIITGQRSGM